LLAQSVVQGFGGRARFVSENYGDSQLAKRFGVTRYPAIFVDDVLVATPNDFGFYGKDEKGEGGRYAPLKSAAAHERFRSDLTRMIELLLAGRKADARAVASPARAPEAKAYPAVTLMDLDGRTLRPEDLKGRVVLVELWATWCPPCRGTLGWLGKLKHRYGDRIAIVAIAVESPEDKVRKLVGELNLPLTWVIGKPEIARAFGDVSAVPTLLVFDRNGKAA
jgi:thiol-disulfide isomerase/thioredoxin